jgi:chitin disaccharide deacetylase
MKALIVNGDDFGISPGVNAGVVEAHREGILTSASMMVDTPHSEEAARLSAAHPSLGVGVHVVVESPGAPAANLAEVERQVERFASLTERLPTHIDSHRDVHRDARLLPVFLAVAERYAVPLRGHCRVHQIRSFYGQWDGETHQEQISADALVRLLAGEVGEGFSELCCHPGYPDTQLASSYAAERHWELAALCDPAVTEFVERHGIRLATFREVGRR